MAVVEREVRARDGRGGPPKVVGGGEPSLFEDGEDELMIVVLFDVLSFVCWPVDILLYQSDFVYCKV